MNKGQRNDATLPDGILECVRVDSSVLMKIDKHRQEQPYGGSGLLYGSFEGWFNEVSDCHALLNPEDGYSEARISEYDELIAQQHAEFNLPSCKVGWYLISHLDSHLSLEAFVNTVHANERHPDSILLVYDTLRAFSGAECPFRAFKLSDEWVKQVYRDEHDQLTVETSVLNKVSSVKSPLFTELKLKIFSNALTRVDKVNYPALSDSTRARTQASDLRSTQILP